MAAAEAVETRSRRRDERDAPFRVVAVESTAVAELGAVVGAFAAVLVLLARGRLGLLAGLAAAAAAEGFLGASLVGGDDLRALVASPRPLALAVAGVLLVAAFSVLFVRHPALAPVALLAVAPFRVHVTVGGEQSFLLVPLYALLASAALALAYHTARGQDVPSVPRIVALPAAFLVAFAGVSLLWSQDARTGTIDLGFVFFPFAVLVAVLARTPFRDWLPRALGVTVVALASAFALYGLAQLWTRELPFAPKIEEANAHAGFFRVTAVFNDPSVYGRHLAVALVVLLAALWLGRVGLSIGIALVGLLFAGIWFAYSQSTLVALFVGVLATTVLAADRRSRTIVVATSAAAALVGAVVVLAIAHGDSLGDATSGRSDLVANTTEVVRDHPVVGVGVGAEREASEAMARAHGDRLGQPSHTSVLTVGAELGLVGVALALAFLLGAAALFAGVRAVDEALGVGLGVVFLTIFVHSLFYSGLFEDPLWRGAAGVAAAAAAASEPVTRAEPKRRAGMSRRRPLAALRRSTTV